MKVILVRNVVGLGNEGSIVEVKNGYGRNYLIPQGMAVRQTKESMVIYEEKKEELAKKAKIIFDENKKVIDDLKEKGELYIKTRVGDGDKLFGAITSLHVTRAIGGEFEIDLDRRQVIVRDTIKSVGKYMATIRLDKENQYDLQFNVIPDVE